MQRDQVEYHVVDVFTRRRFQGNPAGVVLNAEVLTEQQMACVAAELNLSETTFILPADPDGDADLRLRWFSPRQEVEMCGHGTIGAVHVLKEQNRLPRCTSSGLLRLQTAGGVLTCAIESPTDPGQRVGDLIWLDLISPTLTPEPFDSQQWASLLGTHADAFVPEPVPARTQDGDLLVFVRDVLILNGLRPRETELEFHTQRCGLRGVCVATRNSLTAGVTAQSRFFAPAVGVPEDPVTGSVHGPLAVHLVASGFVPVVENMSALTCVQATPSGRAGLVRVLTSRRSDGQYDVRIGADCVTTCSGILYPDAL